MGCSMNLIYKNKKEQLDVDQGKKSFFDLEAKDIDGNPINF